MLTINNLDKIVRYQIDTFRVKSMVCGHTNYHISLIDSPFGGRVRDLKLNRMKNRRGKYTISHGNYSLYLKFSDIQNIDTFCAQIKRLIC
jgi:hypothetical protein